MQYLKQQKIVLETFSKLEYSFLNSSQSFDNITSHRLKASIISLDLETIYCVHALSFRGSLKKTYTYMMFKWLPIRLRRILYNVLFNPSTPSYLK